MVSCMDDKQLMRNIDSVGKRCFIKYFDLFLSETSNAGVAKIIEGNMSYTEKSCISRTSHARAILRSGRGLDALKIIKEASHVEQETREAAKLLLQRLEDTSS